MRTNFVGYSGDCTISGGVEVTGDRLRDYLNDSEEYAISDAVLTRLSDGKQLNVPELLLDRDELWAAESDGSSGIADKRLHTVAYRRRARLGPYAVLGALHERPGVTPLGSLRLTRPFVPFTEARIVFSVNGDMQLRESEALLVNGRLITWIGDANGPVDVQADDHPAFEMLLQGI
jgi:hypothetical protein